MGNRKPGIEKALSYINNGIASRKLSGKLPSIRLLARDAGVSYVTMWRSVKQLAGGRGAGEGMNDNDRQTARAGVPEHDDGNVLWQKISKRLKKDILSGGFPPGQPLPSCKELRHRYGVSFRTLKKSIDALASEEMIRPYKKRYVIPAISLSGSNARVVVLGCGWEDGRIWADFQDKNYFRILESECIQSRIPLDVVVYYKKNGRLHFIHSATGGPYDLSNENILGIVYIVANLQVFPEEILKAVSTLKKPIAVLDVIGCFNDFTSCAENHCIRFFTTTASVFPAKTVARYLLSLKHTRIAFISPFHKAPWSKIRCQSCMSIYQDAGITGGVEPLVLDRYAFQWDFLQGPGKRDNLRSLISQYTQLKNRSHPGISGKFGTLQYGLSKYLTEWNCAVGEIYTVMRPLFDKALHDPSITAWVMANDFAATLAIDYLKELHYRTPEDVSIIAFDNTLDAMEYQITTYDFNNNGIVTMMLRSILAPSTIPVNQGKGMFEVEGRIVVRRSTAQARSTA